MTKASRAEREQRDREALAATWELFDKAARDLRHELDVVMDFTSGRDLDTISKLTHAARLLDLHIQTLWKLSRKLGIVGPADD
jgi:hypothetical protein